MEGNKLGNINIVQNLWHIFPLSFDYLINCEAYGRSIMSIKYVRHLHWTFYC